MLTIAFTAKFIYTNKDAAPHLQELEQALAARYPKLAFPDDPNFGRDVSFLVPVNEIDDIPITMCQKFWLLRNLGWIQEVPYDAEHIVLVIYYVTDLKEIRTLSKEFIRLPALDYLINLTVYDFFDFFNFLAGDPKSLDTYIAVNLADAPSATSRYLIPYSHGVKPNPKYCGKPWYPRSVLALSQTVNQDLEGQLLLLQYLAVHKNPKEALMPTESVCALELDFELTDDESNYCYVDVAQPAWINRRAHMRENSPKWNLGPGYTR